MSIFFTGLKAQVNLKNGLVAYYTLDGHAADSSSNQLHGIKFGTSNTTNRFNASNSAIKFNGSSDYIAVPHSSLLSLISSKTVSVWYKIDDANLLNYPTIIYKQGDQVPGSLPNYALQLAHEFGYGSNRYKLTYFHGNSGGNKSTYTQQDYRSYLGVWIHIVFSYNVSDGFMRIYFNGQISDSLSTPSFVPYASVDSMQIARGSKANYKDSYFKGSLDDIRIYNRALNLAEVKALYNEVFYTYSSVSIGICPGDSTLAGGKYRKAPGTFHDTINITAGYDSVITTNVFYNPTYHVQRTLTICQGGKVLLGGSFVTTSGIYHDTLTTNKGCDSIISTTLIVNPVYNMPRTLVICSGDSSFLAKKFQKNPGVYYDTLISANGCDSIIESILVVNPKYMTNKDVNICQGDNILLGGKIQSTPGVYYDSLKTAKGCDSIIVFTLFVNPKYTTNRNISACQGDSVLLGGKYRLISGTYHDSLKTTKGCDSVIVSVLTVNPEYIITRNVSICPGQKVFVAGALRDSAGVYYELLKTTSGCDSTIITSITHISPMYSTRSLSICSGQNVIINGKPVTTPGIYFDSLKTAGGCDSIVVTNVAFYSSYFSSRSVHLCAGQSISINGKPVFTPGIYNDSFKTINGCDSIVQITLSNTNVTFMVAQIANALKALQDSASYKWLDCSNSYQPIPGATSQIYYATANGDYAVEVTKSGCVDTSLCYTVTGVGIKDVDFAKTLSIYPNPATSSVKIDLGQVYSTADLVVYAVNGQKLISKTVDNSQTAELDIQALASGIYMVEIKAAGKYAALRLAVE
ncbi:MAG TPA: LamG-like jellyroll fold domain-containing protein [Bacteroidia bacterium]|nr:LamG-like jellyroll fold domain-containing protein [Bacteroidia bacterium]